MNLGSALSIMALEGGALAENRPACVLTGLAVGVSDSTSGERGRVKGPVVTHTGQKFPTCSHPSQVTRGHSVEKGIESNMPKRSCFMRKKKKNFLYLV